MAVTFSKALSTTNLLNAYNNNIVEFTSTAIPGGETIVKASINIGGQTVTISPNTSNVFKFNFKEIMRVLINPNSFSDDILPILTASASSHVYNDTTNTYNSDLVTYTITFSDATTDATTKTYLWIKSIEQLEQNITGVVTGGNGVYMLSPFEKATENNYNVSYFEGFPFDISLYLENPGVTTVLNQTNALDFDFTMANTINRLFFSDGRDTIGIEDHLPLVDGLNELKISNTAPGFSLGVENITNGTFDADTDWTKGTGWTIAAGVGTRVSSGANSDISQTIGSVTAGATFQFVVEITARTAGGIKARVQGGADVNIPQSVGVHTVDVIAGASGTTRLRTTASTTDLSIDNVSVKEKSAIIDEIYVNVTKVPSMEGQYVKWLNQYGEWSYWLFNCRHKRSRKTKNIGNVFNDFNDVTDTTVPFFSLGKESDESKTLIAKSVRPEDQAIINGIFESPRVYLFTGIRLTQVTDVSWLAVDIKSSNTTIQDYKRNITNYKIVIELPKRYTMTL